jgi:Right handed beta helix region
VVRLTSIIVLGWALAAALLATADAATVTVRDAAALRKAVEAAKPGDRILLAPGEYQGGMNFRDLHGRPGALIVIAGADRKQPPLIRGGANNFQFSDVTYLELRDLALTGGTGNGLNIDDGGTFETPSHHVTLRRLHVTDVGPSGNHDGIKLSGLDDFRVVECLVERWGDGGSGIDMVGCHNGVIEGCIFRHVAGKGADGVQAKGGSREVTIRHCRFENAGGRGVNIGGSTGLQFFRPRPQGYEAKDIRVEGNTFVGGQTPVAFVGVDGATVRFNTIYRPGRWALRILQETNAPGFVPSRNGVYSDNLIVFRSDELAEAVNIGPNTAPATFRFARNWWYCLDNPARSRPTLPSAEENGVTGQDPRLVAPEKGDFRTKSGSPAAKYGAGAFRAR